MVALSEALWNELAPRGIRVSVLCPGFTNTEIFRSSQRQAPASARGLYTGAEALQTQALLARATSAAEVGLAVLAAIREERFWIFTSPELAPAVRRRCENVMALRDPTPLDVGRR